MTTLSKLGCVHYNHISLVELRSYAPQLGSAPLGIVNADAPPSHLGLNLHSQSVPPRATQPHNRLIHRSQAPRPGVLTIAHFDSGYGQELGLHRGSKSTGQITKPDGSGRTT